MLDARSHARASHGPAPQSNQPAVTLPMFITDASSYEVRTADFALIKRSWLTGAAQRMQRTVSAC